MNESVPELLRQGLIITVIGMTLVFAVLGLLWGIMALLTRVFKDAPAGSFFALGSGGNMIYVDPDRSSRVKTLSSYCATYLKEEIQAEALVLRERAAEMVRVLHRRGVLAKDTHGSTIRLAPPLVIERHDLEWAVGQLREELSQ